MKMIPTQMKDKLAKGTSYPFGAGEISENFRDCPQFDEISLSFHAQKSRHEILKEDETFIVNLSYNEPQKSIFLSKNIEIRPRWDMTVYPLLSEHRKHFRDYMQTEGWQALLSWLDYTLSLEGGTEVRSRLVMKFTYSSMQIDCEEL